MKTALTACVLIGATAAQSGAPLAFTNVSVVPMDTEKVLADHTVIIANGRISAVGPAATTLMRKAPSGSTAVASI